MDIPINEDHPLLIIQECGEHKHPAIYSPWGDQMSPAPLSTQSHEGPRIRQRRCPTCTCQCDCGCKCALLPKKVQVLMYS